MAILEEWKNNRSDRRGLPPIHNRSSRWRELPQKNHIRSTPPHFSGSGSKLQNHRPPCVAQPGSNSLVKYRLFGRIISFTGDHQDRFLTLLLSGVQKAG